MAAVDAYARDFPEEFEWAVSVQAPALLYHLMLSIDTASHSGSEPRPSFRLVDTKPKGTA